jgi:hypothetical protein
MVEYKHGGEEFLYLLKNHVEGMVGEGLNLLKKGGTFTSIQGLPTSFVISATKRPNSLS